MDKAFVLDLMATVTRQSELLNTQGAVIAKLTGLVKRCFDAHTGPSRDNGTESAADSEPVLSRCSSMPVLFREDNGPSGGSPVLSSRPPSPRAITGPVLARNATDTTSGAALSSWPSSPRDDTYRPVCSPISPAVISPALSPSVTSSPPFIPDKYLLEKDRPSSPASSSCDALSIAESSLDSGDEDGDVRTELGTTAGRPVDLTDDCGCIDGCSAESEGIAGGVARLVEDRDDASLPLHEDHLI